MKTLILAIFLAACGGPQGPACGFTDAGEALVWCTSDAVCVAGRCVVCDGGCQ